MAMWSEREEQLLETLLSCAGMRTTAHSLALGLLERFGSLRHVLTADLDTLQARKEITPKIAVLLHLTGCLCRIGTGSDAPLRTTEEIADYLRPYTSFRQTEVLLLLLLDEVGHPLQCRILQEGETDRVFVPVAEILSAVKNPSVAFCVLAHNHPIGSSMPSEKDIAVMRNLEEILKVTDVCFLDNMIFTDNDYTSMAQLGLMHPSKSIRKRRTKRNSKDPKKE